VSRHFACFPHWVAAFLSGTVLGCTSGDRADAVEELCISRLHIDTGRMDAQYPLAERCLVVTSGLRARHSR
jgi:hypothetical protein